MAAICEQCGEVAVVDDSVVMSSLEMRQVAEKFDSPDHKTAVARQLALEVLLRRFRNGTATASEERIAEYYLHGRHL